MNWPGAGTSASQLLDVLREGLLHVLVLALPVRKDVQLNPPRAGILLMVNICPRAVHTQSHSLVSPRVVSVCSFFNVSLRQTDVDAVSQLRDYC